MDCNLWELLLRKSTPTLPSNVCRFRLPKRKVQDIGRRCACAFGELRPEVMSPPESKRKKEKAWDHRNQTQHALLPHGIKDRRSLSSRHLPGALRPGPDLPKKNLLYQNTGRWSDQPLVIKPFQWKMISSARFTWSLVIHLGMAQHPLPKNLDWMV